MAIGTTAALLIGGGLLGSAALSSNASKNAGKTVSQASDRAAQLQNDQFNKLLALQMPAYNRGEQASSVYMQALGLGGQTGMGAPAGAPQGGVPQNPMTGGNRPVLTSGRAQIGAGSRRAQMMTGDYGGQIGMPAYTATPVPNAPGGQLPGGQQPQPQPQPGGATQLDIPAQVMKTPGYQAQLQQGLTAIDRASPLRGGMYSGRRMKALNDYGQQTFGGYYENWMNRVGGIAGQGAQAGQNVGQAGMQNAQNVGGLMMQGANARAQGSLNSANAWSGAIGTGLGMVGGAKGWF